MIERIRDVLSSRWGFDSLLPLQEEAIECVLGEQDSVVVLPTGGGKSLCFQAPAMVMHGTALVISPLISLMKDQVDALNECGVPAARLDSSLSSEKKRFCVDGMRKGELKLVYVSPERIMSEGFMNLLDSCRISFAAVDEAHCVSMWGHDFRPEYRMLAALRERLPGIAVHCYTATATKQVRRDIAEQIGLKDPEFIVGSFDRPNLIYEVKRRSNTTEQVKSVLDTHRNESGIVYCIRRDDVDGMCEKLRSLGYSALPYHAGMESGERKNNQDAFIREEVNTIVATIAFGMGIDKSNVRYVVHAGMPKSLEHYQQESGRAGRDGLEADCLLLYSAGDYATWAGIMNAKEAKARDIALSKLNDMYNYCTGVICRHRAIVNYFGQNTEAGDCRACDVCLGKLECLDDSVVTAQKILSCVLRLNQGFGADYTASVLTGSRNQRILAAGHHELSTYGLLSEHGKSTVRNWIEQLVAQDCLERSPEYKVLGLQPRGYAVLKGKETPRLLKPAEKKKKAAVRDVAKDSWENVDRDLFERLRALRKEMADGKNVPAYVVFSDAALRDMARKRPSTPEEFLTVHGVGDVKCRQYAGIFIEAIEEFEAFER